MTKYKGRTITYDAIGNPTNYYNGAWWTMTWEHGRQLATITQTSTSTTWTNTYNSDGLRTSRTDGTTTYTYYYEEGRLSAIKRNDLNLWIIYDENGPVTLKYGVGTFHYVTNLQGDVVAIVGANGQKLVEYTYDAWGKVLSITGDYAYNLGIHNPILYRGYIYDHETGLYYCQSRYYDPQTRRFLNADAFAATGQGILGNNMFAYCLNNPVMYKDYSGCYPLEAAFEFLDTWLTGEEDEQNYFDDSRIVKVLKKSPKMQAYIDAAIDNYKAGQSTTTGYGEFTAGEDGYELYLSTQHFDYTITVTEETRTAGFGGGNMKKCGIQLQLWCTTYITLTALESGIVLEML